MQDVLSCCQQICHIRNINLVGERKHEIDLNISHARMVPDQHTPYRSDTIRFLHPTVEIAFSQFPHVDISGRMLDILAP